ncbi:DUF4352 domain-containing protein [Streptomyces sp. NPDC051018]|uniref:DUF4352 domain-containing protein n=1 Tax=Streptomyces sp. NPDC051018 TaxID=3365639 RepID=UPI0037915CB5
MNQQYPGPQQPYQPYQGPAPYQPPQPPKRGRSTGATVAIVIGSVFGGLILLGIVGAALGEDPDDTAKGTAKAAPVAEAPAAPPAQKAPAAEQAPAKAAEPKPQAAPEPDVKVTAVKTAFRPSILHDGGEYTSVKVTVRNGSGKKIDINPLYFTITDTDGTKHTAELGIDEGQIDTLDLAPGENVSGVVTGKGRFTPKYVTYTDGLFGEDVRANVS